MSWIRKAETAVAKGTATAAAHDEELSGKTPALHEYLTALVLADGSKRRVSSLTLFAEDGVFKGVLNERDDGLALWASADTVAGLLGALDGLLQAVVVPWRKAGQPPAGKRR